MSKIFDRPTPIPGFPGYFVTPNGEVLSTKRRWYKEVFLQLKTHRIKDGHLQVTLYKGKTPTYQAVHRLVLFAFIGNPSIGEVCRHLDGNPENNSLNNLCWGTHQENEEDKERMGRRPRGSVHASSLLSEFDVRMIIYMERTKEFTQREIAKIYNVCTGTINHIIKKRNWRQIWTVV